MSAGLRNGVLALGLLVVAGTGVVLLLRDGGESSRQRAFAPPAAQEGDGRSAARDGPLAPAGDAPLPRADEPAARPARTAAVPAPLPPPPTPSGARLRGFVVSSAGPVANAQLVLSEHGEQLVRGSTGSSGAFDLQVPRRVEVPILRVGARGLAPLEVRLERIVPPASRNIGNIRLQRGALVTGRVVGARGAAVPGARVVARGFLGRDPGAEPLLETRSEPDGSFRLVDAPRGRLRLEVVAAENGSRALDVVSPSEDVLVELRAPRGLAVRASSTDGSWLADARVRLASEDPLAVPREAWTDDEGRVRFDDLGAEEWMVEVHAPGHRPATERRVRADGREVALTLLPWPCLYGRVLAPSGEPAPEGTRVVALLAGRRSGRSAVASPGDSSEAEVDARGDFRVCDLRPGTYELLALAPGFAPSRSRAFRVGPEGDVAVGSLVLVPGGRLELQVLSGGGPVAGADVEVRAGEPLRSRAWQSSADDPGIVLRARTDAEGRVVLENLEPGPVWVVARSSDHLPEVTGPYAISSGGTTAPRPLQLRRGARVVGRLLEASGEPVPGALLVVRGPRLPVPVQAATDDAGLFRTPALPPGRVELVARAPGTGVRTARAELHLAEGETRSHDLELPARR